MARIHMLAMSPKLRALLYFDAIAQKRPLQQFAHFGLLCISSKAVRYRPLARGLRLALTIQLSLASSTLETPEASHPYVAAGFSPAL